MKRRRPDDFQRYKKRALKDPRLRKAYEAPDDDPFIQIAHQLISLRKKTGLTQAQLAKKIHTSQQAIARLESLNYRGHSLGTLGKLAGAFHKRLSVQFI